MYTEINKKITDLRRLQGLCFSPQDAQQTFTCSIVTVEMLEKGVNYVQI